MAGEAIDDDGNNNFIITEIGKTNNYKVELLKANQLKNLLKM